MRALRSSTPRPNLRRVPLQPHEWAMIDDDTPTRDATIEVVVWIVCAVLVWLAVGLLIVWLA